MINIDDKIDIHFPMEMKPSEQQIDLLQKCKKSINNGKRFILINAPTGSGKSYFAIMFANWYKNNIDEDSKFDIITNSKLLQQQYKDNFAGSKSGNKAGFFKFKANNTKTMGKTKRKISCRNRCQGCCQKYY